MALLICQLWPNFIRRLSYFTQAAQCQVAALIFLTLGAGTPCLGSTDRGSIKLEIPRGHAVDIEDIEITGDGRYAVSIDRSGTLISWDLEKGRSLGVIPLSGTRMSISLASRVPVLSVVRHVEGSHQIVLYDLEDKSIIESVNARSMSHDQNFELYISRAVLFPDARRILVMTNSDFVGVLDRQTHLVSTIATREQIGGRIMGTFVTDDEIIALVISDAKPELIVWRATGELVGRFALRCPQNASCEGGSRRMFSFGNILIYQLYANWADGSKRSLAIGAFDAAANRILWDKNVTGPIFGIATPKGSRLSAKLGATRVLIDPVTGELGGAFVWRSNKLLEGAEQVPAGIVSGGTIFTVDRRLYIQTWRGVQPASLLAAPSIPVIAIAPLAGTNKVAILREGDVLHVDVLSGAVSRIPLKMAWNPRSTLFSSDGTMLFVVEQSEGSAPAIYAIDVSSGQTLWKSDVADTSAGVSLDFKLSLDEEGKKVAICSYSRVSGGDISVAAYSVPAGRYLWSSKLSLQSTGYSPMAPFVVPGSESMWLMDRNGKTVEVGWSDGKERESKAVPDISLLRWTFSRPVGGHVVVAESSVRSGERISAIDWSARHTIPGSATIVEEHESAAPSGIGKLVFGSQNGAVDEVDLERGIISTRFNWHWGPVVGIASFIDQDRIVSASRDGILNVSQRSSGRLIARIFLGEEGDRVVVLPSGFLSGTNRMLRLVSATQGKLTIPSSSVRMADLQRPDLVNVALVSDVRETLEEERRLIIDKWNDAVGDAPIVALLSPEGNSVSKDGFMRVSAAISPGAAGIGSISILRNGQPKIVRRIPQGTESLKEARILDTISLEKGLNRIEVIASDPSGRHVSRPVGVTVTSQRAAAAQSALHLLVIDDRSHATKEADALEGALNKTSRLLVRKIVRRDIALNSLSAEIGRLSSLIEPEDLAVVLIEGHVQWSTGMGSPLELKLADNSGRPIALADILAEIARVPAMKSMVAVELTAATNTIATAARGVVDVAAIDRFIHAAGRIVVIRVASDGATSLVGAMAEGLSQWRTRGDGPLLVSEWIHETKSQLEKLDKAHLNDSIQLFRTMVVGEDFAIGEAEEHGKISRDVSPTHVLISATCIDEFEPCRKKLLPGLKIKVDALEGKTAWISRDGSILGKVSLDALVPLQ